MLNAMSPGQYVACQAAVPRIEGKTSFADRGFGGSPQKCPDPDCTVLRRLAALDWCANTVATVGVERGTR